MKILLGILGLTVSLALPLFGQESQAVLRCSALARERSGKVGDEPEKWLRNEKS